MLSVVELFDRRYYISEYILLLTLSWWIGYDTFFCFLFINSHFFVYIFLSGLWLGFHMHRRLGMVGKSHFHKYQFPHKSYCWSSIDIRHSWTFDVHNWLRWLHWISSWKYVPPKICKLSLNFKFVILNHCIGVLPYCKWIKLLRE